MNPDEDKGQQVNEVDQVTNNIQNVSLEQSAFKSNPNTEVINDQNFTQYLEHLNNSQQAILTATNMGVNLQKQTLEQIQQLPKVLSITNTMQFNNILTLLISAIKKRELELSQPANIQPVVQVQQVQRQEQLQQQDVQMQQMDTVNVIDYLYLYKFIQDMDNNNLSRTASNRLPKAVEQQLISYNVQGVIERVRLTYLPNTAYEQIFVNNPRLNGKFTKDQCLYLLEKIKPDFEHPSFNPVFNPDFNFPLCTVLFLSHKFAVWNAFNNPIHRQSQLSLSHNQNVHILQVEARFAYEQNCRYILLTLSPELNCEFNEKFAFYLANGFQPHNCTDEQPCTRSLLVRDAHTLAWDGSRIYFFSSDQDSFIKCYFRLHTQLSPIFKSGDFSIQILAGDLENKSYLPPVMTKLPPPQTYENLLPLCCTWASLNQNQLIKTFKNRFSPCIGVGGFYIPVFSHPKYAVHGQLIKSMPRFTQNIDINEDNYYRYNIQEGKWFQVTNMETLTDYLPYLSHFPPTISDQQETFNSPNTSKIFPNQKLDAETERVYGSNHFYTMYKRDIQQYQVSHTPQTIHSTFSIGHNPYLPRYTEDKLHQYLVIASSNTYTSDQKDVLYQRYIADESQRSLEVALLFRRSQWILGFNSPYLSWQRPSGVHLQFRLPTIPEYLQVPVPKQTLDWFKKQNMDSYEWIPKQLAQVYMQQQTQFQYRAQEEQYLQQSSSQQQSQQLPQTRPPRNNWQTPRFKNYRRT